MLKLIYTLLDHDGNYKPAKIAIPKIKEYAKKVGADFDIVYGDRNVSKGDLMYFKFKMYDYLDIYDRVLFVDADILIKNISPDIFEVVPEEVLY